MHNKTSKRITFRLLESEQKRVYDFAQRTHLAPRDALKLLIAFGIRQQTIPMKTLRLPTIRQSNEQSHIVNLFITEEQWHTLDEFRFSHHYRSEVEAIRHAIAAGIAIQKELGILSPENKTSNRNN